MKGKRKQLKNIYKNNRTMNTSLKIAENPFYPNPYYYIIFIPFYFSFFNTLSNIISNIFCKSSIICFITYLPTLFYKTILIITIKERKFFLILIYENKSLFHTHNYPSSHFRLLCSKRRRLSFKFFEIFFTFYFKKIFTFLNI